MQTKTIEQLYQKKTPIEHILLRPETYIGPVDQQTQPMYVFSDDKIVLRSITYVPGLYKIFDEILVNAADNKIRDPSMTKLCVEINGNTISVWNNGKSVPIIIHKKENVYVPELIFGHLLTSSNYDDKEKKVTGGRNGYGAKLCNIFSSEFIVETADSKENLIYYQRYTDNMSKREEPVITKQRVRESYTKITFTPDLKRFKMDHLDDDIISLLKKRVYDMCATVKKVKVFLNGNQIPISSFKQYISLYVSESTQVIHEVVNDRWEVAAVLSDEQFQQVSFVNSICTSKGGTHVNHVLDQLVEPVIEKIQKKEKNLAIKPFFVKNSIFLFVNCLIENASFDSQTKETLTLRVTGFGSRCTLSDDFVKNAVSILSDSVLSQAREKISRQLKKTDGFKRSGLSGIPKLDDANKAGTKQSQMCSLILTEGDSAKTLAVSGLSVVGRDYYGVFPLRGKLLNVREANFKQIMENEELNSLKKILALQHNKEYTSTESLRYGHVIIMTDQDHDGSHIKGLIINFFDHFFPSLLKINGFLNEFITPIIRVRKVRNARITGTDTTDDESDITVQANAASASHAVGTVIDFFTIPEYNEWRASTADIKNWDVKYYKGLGTSSAKDAKQYFSNLSKHIKPFTELTTEDRALIDLAFNRKKADDRKLWLKNCTPGIFLDHSVHRIPIKDFINKELILFSMADNVRSIPSVVDGFKPGQRKVMYCCFKKNLKSEIKVAQLVGYVSEHSAYHHGEVSLQQTIVKLAHDFVGSNNINLLVPSGQFGTRLQGGKDAASARYIFTTLSDITRKIFVESDDALLNYLTEDNMKIEPMYYVPIVPMVLVNGADGIGTGWLTKIPNYDLMDIIENIKLLLDGKEMKKMVPYYRGFRGEIECLDISKYRISGLYNVEDDELTITELPVKMWTQTYKEFLDKKIEKGEIREFRDYSTDRSVHLKITVNCDGDMEKKFNLSMVSICNNFVCFDRDGKIKKYKDAEEILEDFFKIRLEYYDVRKKYLLNRYKEELVVLENKVRFIREIVEKRLVISNRKKADIVLDLEKMGFARVDSTYDYLLNMSILSLTLERIDKLNDERNRKQKEYDTLLHKTIKEIWIEELDVLRNEYLKLLEEDEKILGGQSIILSSTKKTGRKTRKPAKGNTVPSKNTTKKGTKTGQDVGQKNKRAGKKAATESMNNDGKNKAKKGTGAKRKKISAAKQIIVESSTESSSGDKPWEKY